MSTCPECRASYSPNGGGHCRDHCHQTFANDATADAHRIGPYNPPGQRRCLTPEEMLAKGWRLTARGWTKHKRMPPDVLSRRRGGP